MRYNSHNKTARAHVNIVWLRRTRRGNSVMSIGCSATARNRNDNSKENVLIHNGNTGRELVSNCLVIRDSCSRVDFKDTWMNSVHHFLKKNTGIMYSSLHLLTVGSNCGDIPFIVFGPFSCYHFTPHRHYRWIKYLPWILLFDKKQV